LSVNGPSAFARQLSCARCIDWHSLCISDARADKMLTQTNRKTHLFLVRRTFMKSLTIKDLAMAEQLDSKAMQAVRGGYIAFTYYPDLSLKFDNSKTVNAQQLVNQSQDVSNISNNGNAFAKKFDTTITPTMTGTNNVNVY